MTSDNVAEAETVEPLEPQPSKAVDDRLIDELASRRGPPGHPGPVGRRRR
jgi:putative transposase